MFIILLLTIISVISADKLPMNNSIFRPDPIETVILDGLEYSFYNYRVTWEEAKIICLGYESQLVTLDTEKKAIFATKQLANSNLDFEELWIGSKMNSHGDWIWEVNDEKLSTSNFFRNSTTMAKYTNHFTENVFHCLTLFRRHYHIPFFIPRRCSEQKAFICERDTFSTSNIIKVFTINIDKKTLVLYSANVTWYEAVFQCRQQGLQLAEISTLTEARSMAVGMLKVRPKSIETAWIAGYINNQVWKWLSSGRDIPRNELWQNDHDFGNCLLLDRHLCERPRYLSLRCDRRRDFICQTPQGEELGNDPLQVSIDNCKYWVVVVPLDWYEANQFCKSLNSTLVSIDSPRKANHIANIMLDNKELLRHIWIGGMKESGGENVTGKAAWKWNDTGKVIPGPGQSFVRWYKDSRLFEQNSDCLNLDLEDIDDPIIYGLNCNNKQRYICQEESSACTKMVMKSSSLYLNNPEITSKITATTSRFNVTERVTEKFDTSKSDKELYNVHQNSLKSTDALNNSEIMSKTHATTLWFKTTKRVTEKLEIISNINSVSRRMFNDESKNNTITNNKSTKNNGTEFNDRRDPEQSLLSKNKSFKDLIEYMVKKVNDNKSEAIQNTSDHPSLLISTSQSNDKSSDLTQAQMVSKPIQVFSLKENISKLVQTSIEKRLRNISSATTSTKNPVTYISSSNMTRKFENKSSIPINLFSTQVDRPFRNNHEKWAKLSPLDDNNPNVIFNFSQTMRNTLDTDRVNNFGTHKATKSMNAHKKHKVNNTIDDTTRNKNEITILRPTAASKFENSIQSLKNYNVKNIKDDKVNDLLKALKHEKSDSNLEQNNTLSKNNYVSPWNVLLNGVMQSYNSKNKSLIGFKVVEFP